MYRLCYLQIKREALHSNHHLLRLAPADLSGRKNYETPIEMCSCARPVVSTRDGSSRADIVRILIWHSATSAEGLPGAGAARTRVSVGRRILVSHQRALGVA